MRVKFGGAGVRRVAIGACVCAAMVVGGCSGGTSNAPKATTTALPSGPVTLNVWAASSLSAPLDKVDQLFEAANPSVTVNLHKESSVKIARDVTQLGQPANVVFVADYSIIPTYFFTPTTAPKATWYAGFATTPFGLAYTSQSKYASEITSSNWYTVLAQSGVSIAYANPDVDPGGYRFIWALELAQTMYNLPNLMASVLANAPASHRLSAETAGLPLIQAGQVNLPAHL